MYRLLIVDDDPWVREWFEQHVHWREYGFEEVYAAVNGSHALEIVEDKSPHVIVTDIKMDTMDGLELLERVRQGYPDIRVILLSGYHEFEYARAAIKNGAVDYLLKPVEETELLALIKRVLKEIEQEQAIREREHRVSSQLEQNMPVLQEKYIQELLAGNRIRTGEEIQIDFSAFHILVFEVDGFKVLSGKLDKDAFGSLKQELKRTVEEHFAGKGKCISFFENHRLVTGFNPQAQDSTTPNSSAPNGMVSLHRISSEFCRKTGYTVSVGVSEEKSDMSQARDAYLEAVEALGRKFYTGSGQVNRVDAQEPLSRESFEIRKKQQLQNALAAGDSSKVTGLIEEMVGEIRERKVAFDVLQRVIVRLIGILEESLEKAGINRDKAFVNYLDMNMNVDEFETVQDLKEWLLSAFTITIDIIHGRGSRRSRKLIDDAIEYLKVHMQEDISLDDVAKVLYVNPAYLSRLFKGEVGETFTHYLMKLRIEKAKELLKNSYLKVYEISSQVGYMNERYFSRIFKDFEGVTPAEYRDSNIGKTFGD